MPRRLCILLALIAVFGLAVPEIPVFHKLVGVSEAGAQQKRKRKSLFDILFKRRKKTRNSNNARSLRNRGTALPGVRNAGRTTNNRAVKRVRKPVKPKVVVVKNENARKLLVIGDFVGSDLARGLERRYASNPDLVVLNLTKSNSGLVRNDVRDWPAELPKIIEEYKPAAVLVLVGLNDRQKMRLESGWKNKLSDEWKAEYANRANALAKAGRAGGLPFVWVGLPPVRSNKMNTDYLAFNEITRAATEAVSGEFVDIWEGYTNADGKYVSAGPDINGQIVRLRTSKGISMTRAGRQKLAFYADKALRKIGVVGDTNPFFLSSLGGLDGSPTQPQKPEYDPVGTGRTVVIPLGAPASDGGESLEGAGKFLEAKDAEKSVSYELVEKGFGLKPQPERIDAMWGVPAEPEKPVKQADDKEEKKTSELSPTLRGSLPANASVAN